MRYLTRMEKPFQAAENHPQWHVLMREFQLIYFSFNFQSWFYHKINQMLRFNWQRLLLHFSRI